MINIQITKNNTLKEIRKIFKLIEAMKIKNHLYKFKNMIKCQALM